MLAVGADHRYMPLLVTCPGIGWILAFTIASELGDINRFPTPLKLVGYTGLCPKVDQSGERDRRGPLRKNGPNYLRWALVEAAHTAVRRPCYQSILARQITRHRRKRGTKIAAIEVARKLAEAIWYMLSRNQPFCSGRDWRNGVDSPYGQPHREDPQVVGDREEALTTLTSQTA